MGTPSTPSSRRRNPPRTPPFLELEFDPETLENYPGVDEDDSVADALAALLGADGQPRVRKFDNWDDVLE